MKPHRIYSLLVMCIFVCFAVPADLYADQLVINESEFETRPGMADFLTMRTLIDNPTKIDLEVTSWDDDGMHFIRSESDFHAIIPVSLEKVLGLLIDYEATKDIYSRVRKSIIIDAEDDPYERHTVRTDIFISVLGFGDGYSYVTNNWVDEADGTYLLRFNLEDSVDDKLYQMIGSWYVEPVDYDGVEYTYIRQYSIIGIQQGNIAMEIAMRTFGALSLKQMLRQFSKATKRL